MAVLQASTADRRTGLAFITGSVAMIVTMAIHPTGQDLFVPGQMSHAVHLGIIAHGIGLCSVPILFLGALGFSLRVRPIGVLSMVALVIYGFAAIAVLNAIVFSGFVVPQIARQMAGPDADSSWRMAFALTGYFNQAFARVYVLGSSTAILLWSVWMLRSHAASRGIFLYGTVIGPLILLLTLIGHLRLDVHGFGAIVLGQTVWLIGVGVWLQRPGHAAVPEGAQ